MEMKMSTSIMIHREYDHDAIAAECPYFVEVTEGQAFAFAKLVERANKGVFVSADEGYDAFVESFGLSLLTDQIDEIKAIFTNPEVDRSAERRVGHECVSKGRCRRSPEPYKKKNHRRHTRRNNKK